jgi:pimeloyl-ACP methyl ester carboxylesterase
MRWGYRRLSCSGPQAVATSRNRSLFRCLIALTGLVLVGAPRSLQGRPAFADEVDRLTDPVDPSWVEESLTWFPRYHDVPDWYIEDRIRDGLRVPAHVWKAGLAGLTTAVPPSECGTITAPTVIIWGE